MVGAVFGVQINGMSSVWSTDQWYEQCLEYRSMVRAVFGVQINGRSSVWNTDQW